MQHIKNDSYVGVTIYQCTKVNVPKWTSKYTEVVHHMYLSMEV